ncbi:alpha-glucosidase-like [Argiope bruennichi]|uniref:alpha-glucosidase-like n=1 Tax=Argiope bruennichi TaxID=94029 RepID=UPI002494878B|nr:alpha-glucosidase-like [Argiope bruennichi]XP_055951018.1 alpha-glucosidase-like [Argiope bruennichi]
MSTLPALDDLQSKARLSGNLTLDLRPQRQTSTPHVVTPSTTTQEQESRCSHGLFKNCTTVFQCSRFKSDIPSYRPLHKQMSTSSLPWRQWSERSRFCVLFASVVLSTVAFWAGVLLWNTRSPPDISAHHLGNHQWYRDAVFYEIFPASFLDTDSDGYGDFQGIIRKLDYIRDLGTTAIRLNSIFSALDYPLEYEHIIDLRSADPHLGRLADFAQLVRAVHKKGLKIVLDLNPTVTSDQHTWALHWQRGIPGYEHFYASANRSKAPPEMENSEGPPSEEWELTQRTFGGHYVLNWSNPSVQKEYEKALAHWTAVGVDGIYMKHLENMHVHNHRHIPIILRQWRELLDSLTFGKQPRTILIVSSKFADYLVNEMGMDKSVLADVDLLDHPLLVGSGEEMGKQVQGLRSAWPEGWPVPMWHLGSSDTFRIASRIEPRYHMAAMYLLMSLPGANSVFYGDEIGLKDSYDVFSGRVYRGGQLTPMQWTADNSSGGFTDNLTNPWLPINPEHYTTNVQNQQSRLREFVRILSFRKNTLKNYRARGQHVDVLDPNIIVLERTHHKHKSKRIILAANFGNVSEEKEFPEAYGNVKVIMTTAGPTRTRVRSRGFTLSPGAAFVAEVTLLYYPSPAILND